MNSQLFIDIKNSLVIRFYAFLFRIYKHFETFKIFFVISFIIGALSLFFERLHNLAVVFLVPCFIFGVSFAICGAITHILVYFKIKNLSEKYEMEEIKIKEIIDEIYENKD